MTFRKLCLLSTAALATACSSGTPSLSQSDAVAQLSAAECNKIFACCAGNLGSFTLAACEAQFSAQLGANLTSELADGLTSFSGSAAANCIADVNAWSCEEILNEVASANCVAVLQGDVSVGGKCNRDDDCTSHLCEGITYGSNNTVVTQGTCVAQAPVGGSCATAMGSTSGDPCAAGGYDSQQAGSPDACTCVALIANGSACTDNSQCSSHYCDTTTSNACQPYPQLSTLPAATCQAIASNLGSN